VSGSASQAPITPGSFSSGELPGFVGPHALTAINDACTPTRRHPPPTSATTPSFKVYSPAGTGRGAGYAEVKIPVQFNGLWSVPLEVVQASNANSHLPDRPYILRLFIVCSAES
jgi:hypothetical protein